MTLLAASAARGDHPLPPSDLDLIPDLLGDWDATLISGLSDGQDVMSWTDAAGTANAVQVPGFGRPTYRVNQRGTLPAVRFSTGQALAIDAVGAALTGLQSWTLFVVQRPTIAAAMSPFVLENTSGVLPVHHVYNAAPGGSDNSEHRTLRRNAAGTLKSRGSTPKADIPSGRWAITANRFTGTTDTAWINGAKKWADHDLDLGPVAFDSASIGGWRRAGLQFYNGDLAHLVVYARALSDAEVHQAGAILAAQWGLWWGPYNASAPLDIPVVGPSDVEAIHPDVVDFGASPFAGHRYWMAMTPYNGVESTEEPGIVATNSLSDGGTWAVPAGFANPITSDPPGIGHMADTDIVFDPATGRLWVFYVSTDKSTYVDVRGKWTSGNGSWSSESTVISEPYPGILNPSFVKTSTGWRLYYVKGDTIPYRFAYRDTTSSDPSTGYGPEIIGDLQLSTGTAEPFLPRRPQNLNMVRDEDGILVAVVSDSPRTDSLGGGLVFCRTTDGGHTFRRTGPTVIDTPLEAAWDDSAIYRASIVTDPAGVAVISGGEIDCYYSARRASDGEWGTGWVRLPVSVLRF